MSNNRQINEAENATIENYSFFLQKIADRSNEKVEEKRDKDKERVKEKEG